MKRRTLCTATLTVLAVAVAAHAADGLKTSRQGGAASRGWLGIAYDFNQDDRVDAYEFIHLGDLQQARAQSRGRDATGDRCNLRRRLDGTIADLRKRSISGQKDDQLIARVQTDSGRTHTVILGSDKGLQRLDLQKGDKVSLYGTRCRLNDRPAMKACKIKAGDQSVTINKRSGSQGQQAAGGRTRQQSEQQDRTARSQDQAWRQAFDTRQEQAKEQSQQRRERTDSSQASQAQGIQVGGQRLPLYQSVQLRGTVQATRTIQLGDRDEPHLFARVLTTQGNRILVDLGPQVKAERLGLSQGARISANGVLATINRQPVVMAYHAQAGGENLDIRHPRGQRTIRFRGRIVETTSEQLERHQAAHIIALVELGNGRRVPVDFGRIEDLRSEGVTLERGQDITFLGRAVNIGDKRILVANELTLDGTRIDIDWIRKSSASGMFTGRSR